MSESASPSEKSSQSPEPATGPVLTPPPASPQPAFAPVGPPPVYVRESSRLNKAAAWVGIVAGSLFIVAVIFGSGFYLGKEVGDDDGEGPRGHHRGGHDMMMRPGQGMPPMGPREFERRPGFAGPFGPGGPIIEIPRPPEGSGGPATTAPPRP
ncbi:MAG: hypothetical protein K0U76_01055 [Actinomycetia bacterium]|nr:hypothetical protein [Actinomycetes bacterium]MCH9699971.1 hypothetical protein [Actinomycetes bacterium]MCH9762048.1 hypothetical protein [Actinomycetes bacterium]